MSTLRGGTAVHSNFLSNNAHSKEQRNARDPPQGRRRPPSCRRLRSVVDHQLKTHTLASKFYIVANDM